MNIKYIAKELARICEAPSSEIMEVVAIVDGEYGDGLKLTTGNGPMEKGKLYVMAKFLGSDKLLIKEKGLIVFQVDNDVPFPTPDARPN